MKRNSLLELVSIAFFGSIIGRGVIYAVNIVLARGFGPAVVGSFAIGIVVMNLGSLVARAGLDGVIKRRVPIHAKNSDYRLLTGGVLTGLTVPALIGTVIAIMGYLTVRLRPGITDVPVVLLVPFFVAIPIVGVMRMGLSISQGFKETRYLVIVRDLLQPVTALCIVFIGTYVFGDVFGAFVGYSVSFVLGTITIIWYLKRQGAFTELSRPAFELRTFGRLAPPLFFASTIRYLIFWADVLMLGVLTTAAATGRYQIAYQTSIVLTFSLTALNSLFPSVAADLFENDDRERLGQLYSVSTKWILYLSSFVYILLVLLTEDLLSIFGPEFGSAGPLLIIVATGQLAAVGTGPAGFLLTMTDYERFELAHASVVSVVNIVLNIVLIQRYGALGAAVATGSSIMLLNGLRLLEVRLTLGLSPYSRDYAQGVVGLMAATLVVIGVSNWVPDQLSLVSLVLSGLSAAVVFAVILLTIGISERDTILFEQF